MFGQTESKDPRIVGNERRQAYQNFWQVALMSACLEKPGWCLFSALCPCCSSYSVRKQLLYNDMRRYVCCGGACPCSGKMGEQSAPEFCLAMETVCCFAQSVASSRFMIQDEMLVQTTKCDNCIIGTMIALQYAACLFSIAAMLMQNDSLRELSAMLNLISDMVYCSVCACMQTQHKAQLDVRDGVVPPKEGIIMVAPPVMAMIRPGAPPPPTAVYVGGVPTASPVLQYATVAPVQSAPMAYGSNPMAPQGQPVQYVQAVQPQQVQYVQQGQPQQQQVYYQ